MFFFGGSHSSSLLLTGWCEQEEEELSCKTTVDWEVVNRGEQDGSYSVSYAVFVPASKEAQAVLQQLSKLKLRLAHQCQLS
jgi:hypothetical protein